MRVPDSYSIRSKQIIRTILRSRHIVRAFGRSLQRVGAWIERHAAGKKSGGQVMQEHPMDVHRDDGSWEGQQKILPLDLVRALAKVAIPLWRARRRVSLEAQTNPQLGVALRYLEMAGDQLVEAGVHTRDFHLQPYDAGMSAFIHPIAFNEIPDCQAPTVIETITPAVFFRNRPVLKGEVIVGIPQRMPNARAGCSDDSNAAETSAGSVRTGDGKPVLEAGVADRTDLAHVPGETESPPGVLGEFGKKPNADTNAGEPASTPLTSRGLSIRERSA
jgi:hypothetical protein